MIIDTKMCVCVLYVFVLVCVTLCGGLLGLVFITGWVFRGSPSNISLYFYLFYPSLSHWFAVYRFRSLKGRMSLTGACLSCLTSSYGCFGTGPSKNISSEQSRASKFGAEFGRLAFC